MPITTDLERIFHFCRIRLYKNQLPGVKGSYVARPSRGKTLYTKNVCSSMVTRTGFPGKYEELVAYVEQYLEEVIYLLLDGFTVSNGYYSIKLNIKGTFDSISEEFVKGKNPVGIRFGTGAKLRKLLEKVTFVIDGIADTNGYISEFTDDEGKVLEGLYLSGDMFTIRGSKIKIAGDDPDNGVYFVPVDDNPVKVKVERIGKNTPSKITGIVPAVSHQFAKLEIRTQYCGNNNQLLKEPRIIRSPFAVEHA